MPGSLIVGVPERYLMVQVGPVVASVKSGRVVPHRRTTSCAVRSGCAGSNPVFVSLAAPVALLWSMHHAACDHEPFAGGVSGPGKVATPS